MISADARGGSKPRSEVHVARQVVTPESATSVQELYLEAEADERRGATAEARAKYRRIVDLDPDSEWGIAALRGFALCSEALQDHVDAARAFETLAERHPSSPWARSALLGAVRLRVFLEEWERGASLADAFLERHPDASDRERLVLHGAHALHAVARGDEERATLSVERGRHLIEAHGWDRAGAVPRDLVQIYYALGEVRRLRAERIDFDPLPPVFGVALEERCQLLLAAQSAYSDTMRAYDSHWSSMAGVRIAELYASLHEDIMRVPAPLKARTEAQQRLFAGAMRLRYSVLLRKGLAMLEHTRDMAQRTGETSRWVVRAAELEGKLRRARDEEDAALDGLGYTRAELQAALDELIAGHTQAPVRGR